MTRGIECNNPMNLEVSSIAWNGEIEPTPDPSGVLCAFGTMQEGLRAGIKNLVNQQLIHNLNTWAAIIEKYAPPSENNTLAYIKSMCDATGVKPYEHFDLTDQNFLEISVKALIIHEQGANPCTDADILTEVQSVLNSIE